MILADTKASTPTNLVCWLLQVFVPITYCTALLPIEVNEGVNNPLLVRYGEAVHLPVDGVTVNCTGAPLLQIGPMLLIIGTGGFSTDTPRVYVSGHKVAFG